MLLIDNYDSFTYNLKDYFEQLGEQVIVVKNDAINIDNIHLFNFSKIVLSPGPNTPAQAGNMMSIIDAYYTQYPILGVCLGHQALGQFFGAQLVKAKLPMHGKVSAIKHNEKGIYKNLPNPLKVCRYHSLVLQNFDSTPLEITASSKDNECMSFQHKTHPIIGIQYHPEAILTENGLEILRNWLDK